jgi:hypothetical protein
MATSNLSKDEMVQLFSRAMAGYTQQLRSSSQEQFNPNTRYQEREHPDGMQTEETSTFETTTDEEIAAIECEEGGGEWSLHRDEIRKTTKKQKRAAKPNPSTPQAPFSALKAATVKAYTFTVDKFRTIPSSQPVNPYKATIQHNAQRQPKTTEGTGNPFKDIIQHNSQGRPKTAGSTNEGPAPNST